MKVAVTSQGQDLRSPVDPRFGRAKCFIVLDMETGVFCAVDNSQNLNAAQGAGIQAARNVVESGATAAITGHVGPKAFGPSRREASRSIRARQGRSPTPSSSSRRAS